MFGTQSSASETDDEDCVEETESPTSAPASAPTTSKVATTTGGGLPNILSDLFPGKSSAPISSAESSPTVASSTTGFPNILSDLFLANRVFQVPVLKLAQQLLLILPLVVVVSQTFYRIFSQEIKCSKFQC